MSTLRRAVTSLRNNGVASRVKNTATAHPLIVITLFALSFAMHGDALRLGFGRDDGGGLALALRLDPVDYFLDPATSAAVSGMSISPWHAFVYNINIKLFGLNPYWHHFHLITVVGLTATATYYLLSLWLQKHWAMLGAILFIIAPPTTYISHEEMSGHYVYGSLFMILAIYIFILAGRHSSRSSNYTSAFFYLLAIACKEIYVPLPLALTLYPEGNLIERLHRALPHWILLVLYAIWRYSAFGGSLLGPKGHGAEVNLADAARSFFHIPELLFGDSAVLAASATILTVFIILNLDRKQWLFAMSIVIMLLVPLFPVSVNPGFSIPDRLMYLVWWAISSAFAWAGSVAASPLQKPIALSFICVCLSAAFSTSKWRHEIELNKAMWAEYDHAQHQYNSANIYIKNDYEAGYFAISGNLAGLIEATELLGLLPPKNINLIAERRTLRMIEGTPGDTPENSYTFDSATSQLRQANSLDELNRWKSEIPTAVKPYLLKTIPKFGLRKLGHIDDISTSENTILISGWGPQGQLIVSTPEYCKDMQYDIYDRPDVVVSTQDSRWLHSGFHIRLRCRNTMAAKIAASQLCVIIGSRSFPATLENPFYPECLKLTEGHEAHLRELH
ncbi:MAG: hypothetical protein PHT19_11435 [Methylococcus sp.]|nr:hypothetical protein [Methylococcus sp.]